MPPITIPADDSGRIINRQRVYTKTSWAAEWTLQPAVVCLDCQWAAAPTIPSASFYYRYGVAVKNNTALNVWNKFTLPTYGYVKVEFDTFDLSLPTDDEDYETTITWHGVVVSKEDMPHGDQVIFDAAPRESGTQTFRAVGFEYLLDRHYVNDAWAKEEDKDPERLLSAPIFNHRQQPNRTTGTTFTNDQGITSSLFFIPTNGGTETPEDWSTRDIVRYLLAWSTPLNDADELKLPFQLLDTDTILPTWDKPEFSPEGQRLLVLLNSLISRQRGLSYYCRVDDGGEDQDDVISVIPFSLRASTASAGSLGTWAANGDKIDVDLRYVRGVSIADDGHNRFDRVRVVGGRVIYCWTLGATDAWTQRVNGWTSAQQTLYEDGLGDHADYAGWSDGKQKIIDSLNLAGPQIKDVYSRYQLSDLIHPLVTNFPPIDTPTATGSGVSPQMRYYFQRPILPFVPLNVGVSYATDGDFDWDQPYDSPVPYATTAIDGTNVAFDMRYTGIANTQEATADKLRFTANVVATGNPREFQLLINGTLPHLVGWGGTAAVTRDFGDAPGVEISRLTLAMESDERTEVIVDTGNEVDAIREKRIEIGDRYRAVFLCKNTISGIKQDLTTGQDPTKYDTNATARLIRDDRPYMESIASAAAAWYSEDRRSLNWATLVPSSNFEIGQMIVALQVTDSTTLTCNSCITAISMKTGITDHRGMPVTRWEYQTQFAELDFG
jgi:hypothetical protein